MKAYTYIEKGRFELKDKPEPRILDSKDAIVKVTLASICSSDLHIKDGYVNNCQSPDGGWALGCRIDGGQANSSASRMPTRDSTVPMLMLYLKEVFNK